MATRHASKKVLRNDEDDDNHEQHEYEDAEAFEYFSRHTIAAPKVRVEAKPPSPVMLDPDFFSAPSDDHYVEERYAIAESAWHTDPPRRPYNPYWDDEWVVAERNLAPVIDVNTVMNTAGKSITISGPATGGAGASSASYERIGGEAPVKMTHAGAAKSNVSHLSTAHKFETAYQGKRNHRD